MATIDLSTREQPPAGRFTPTGASPTENTARHKLTWRLGILDRFGWTISPDGTVLLVELVSHLYDGASTVTCLHSGDRRLLPGDGSWDFIPLSGGDACDIVGIPAPTVDGNSGEGARRTDPYHVERWRSPWFVGTLALIRYHRLATGHPLRRLAAGDGFVIDQDGAYEAGEGFCARVSLRRSVGRLTQREAILEQLAADLGYLDEDHIAETIAASGWPAVLPELDAAREYAAQHITEVAPAAAIDVQLTFSV